MTKAAKTLSVIFGLLILLAVCLKGYFIYQQKYVCEPKAQQAISNFIASVAVSSYESLRDNSMFTDKQQFATFKSHITKEYSAQIRDWMRGVDPYVVVQFSLGSYALMLVVDHKHLPTCWGTEYRVLTVR